MHWTRVSLPAAVLKVAMPATFDFDDLPTLSCDMCGACFFGYFVASAQARLAITCEIQGLCVAVDLAVYDKPIPLSRIIVLLNFPRPMSNRVDRQILSKIPKEEKRSELCIACGGMRALSARISEAQGCVAQSERACACAES